MHYEEQFLGFVKHKIFTLQLPYSFFINPEGLHTSKDSSVSADGSV
jgi:hypothetical protein